MPSFSTKLLAFICLLLLVACQNQPILVLNPENLPILDKVDFLVFDVQLEDAEGHKIAAAAGESLRNESGEFPKKEQLATYAEQKKLAFLLQKNKFKAYSFFMYDYNKLIAFERLAKGNKDWAVTLNIAKNADITGPLYLNFYESFPNSMLRIPINLPKGCQKIELKGNYAWSDTSYIFEDLAADSCTGFDFQAAEKYGLYAQNYIYELVQKKEGWWLKISFGFGMPAGKTALKISLFNTGYYSQLFEVNKKTRNGFIHFWIPFKDFEKNVMLRTAYKFSNISRQIADIEAQLQAINEIKLAAGGDAAQIWQKKVANFFESTVKRAADEPQNEFLQFLADKQKDSVFIEKLRFEMSQRQPNFKVDLSLAQAGCCPSYYLMHGGMSGKLGYMLFHTTAEERPKQAANKDAIDVWYDFLAAYAPLIAAAQE